MLTGATDNPDTQASIRSSHKLIFRPVIYFIHRKRAGNCADPDMVAAGIIKILHFLMELSGERVAVFGSKILSMQKQTASYCDLPARDYRFL